MREAKLVVVLSLFCQRVVGFVGPPFHRRVLFARSHRGSPKCEEDHRKECEAYLEEIGGPERWQATLQFFDEQCAFMLDEYGEEAKERFRPMSVDALLPRWQEVVRRRSNESQWLSEVEEYNAVLEEESRALEEVAKNPMTKWLADSFGSVLSLELKMAGSNETRYATFVLNDEIQREFDAIVASAARDKLRTFLAEKGESVDFCREALGITNATMTDDEVLDEYIRSPAANVGVADGLISFASLVLLFYISYSFFDALFSFMGLGGGQADVPSSTDPFLGAPSLESFGAGAGKAAATKSPGEAGLDAAMSAFQNRFLGSSSSTPAAGN